MESKHTPGPWKWEINQKSHSIKLVAKQGLGPIVMDFVRWGMQMASPRFLVREGNHSVLVRADELGEVEIGREHHAKWYKVLNHPDARLIAAAPDLLEACEYALKLIDSSEKCETCHPRNEANC